MKTYEKVSTIQKRNNLNDVFRCTEVGPGGGYHNYVVYHANSNDVIDEIQFQCGPRMDPHSVAGVLDTDLLEIVRDRLAAFQRGEYATRENACALTHIEEALMWMNKRAEDRAERNVLGTMNK